MEETKSVQLFNAYNENPKTYKVGDKVHLKIYDTIYDEGFVCYGLFYAEVYSIFGWYVGDKNGEQISEGGLEYHHDVIN